MDREIHPNYPDFSIYFLAASRSHTIMVGLLGRISDVDSTMEEVFV
jgi:hypothetical protein